MGFYKTEKCFFTGEKVIRNDETNGNYLDGFFYVIKCNNNFREIRLSHFDDWENDNWVKENGLKLIELIDKHNRWNIFSTGITLGELKDFYYNHKNK